MALPVALSAAALGLQVAGSVSSGIAQGKAANYQAQVAQNNATIAKQNAAHAASVGAAETEAAGLKARSRLASVRTGFAANNLDVNTGSPADVQVGQHKVGALDTATVAHNAALQVYGYQNQAGGYAAQSGLDRMEASYAPIAGALRGAGQLAAGAKDFPIGGGGDGDSLPDGKDPIGALIRTSLVSGPPSVGSDHAWMQSPNNPTDEDN